MDIQELSDRIEIPATLTKYATGLDIPGRNFEAWKTCFTPDAVFVNWNGPDSEMPASEMIPWLTMDDPVYSHQHLLSNIVITELGENTAKTRAEYIHVGVHRTEDENTARWIMKGGFYEDEFIRTAEGWRIQKHVITRRWDKYEIIPWPPANTTWSKTQMAPEL
ncbi:MAG: nuclear transport factor 2 family protein [Microbacteriaceae bacterium]